jgi:hypothetical protein
VLRTLARNGIGSAALRLCDPFRVGHVFLPSFPGVVRVADDPGLMAVTPPAYFEKNRGYALEDFAKNGCNVTGGFREESL